MVWFLVRGLLLFLGKMALQFLIKIVIVESGYYDLFLDYFLFMNSIVKTFWGEPIQVYSFSDYWINHLVQDSSCRGLVCWSRVQSAHLQPWQFFYKLLIFLSIFKWLSMCLVESCLMSYNYKVSRAFYFSNIKSVGQCFTAWGCYKNNVVYFYFTKFVPNELIIAPAPFASLLTRLVTFLDQN